MDFGSLLGSLPALLGSGQGGALLGPSLAGPFDKQGLIAMAQHDRAVWEAEIAVASGPGMVQVNRSFTGQSRRRTPPHAARASDPAAGADQLTASGA